MARRRNGEGESVANGLVKSGIPTRSENDWLMSVLLVVLNVPHLVVNRNEVVLVSNRALLYSVIAFCAVVMVSVSIHEVPSGCMANLEHR